MHQLAAEQGVNVYPPTHLEELGDPRRDAHDYLYKNRYIFLIWTMIFNKSVLKLILYGPRMRINQSYPGNTGN